MGLRKTNPYYRTIDSTFWESIFLQLIWILEGHFPQTRFPCTGENSRRKFMYSHHSRSRSRQSVTVLQKSTRCSHPHATARMWPAHHLGRRTDHPRAVRARRNRRNPTAWPARRGNASQGPHHSTFRRRFFRAHRAVFEERTWLLRVWTDQTNIQARMCSYRARRGDVARRNTWKFVTKLRRKTVSGRRDGVDNNSTWWMKLEITRVRLATFFA